MSDNYDRIARFYDIDMGRNMPFDDIGFYVQLASASGGRVLELGCGNGRVLLPMLAHRLDAFGIDASAGMLAELRRKFAGHAAGDPPVCRMDLRALAFRSVFDTVLCPYSLVTYLTTDDDFSLLLDGVRRSLRPSGVMVIDAFVPRPVLRQPEFQLDYQRAFDDAVLWRWKRVTPFSSGLNRIERRYRWCDRDGVVFEEIDIVEHIRPYTLALLEKRLAAGGFAIEQCWQDYAMHPGELSDASDPQFLTLSAQVKD